MCGNHRLRSSSSGQECVRAKVTNVYGGDTKIPLCLEVGAGSGLLAAHLRAALDGWVRVVATDSDGQGGGRHHPAELPAVETLDAESALARHAPRLVLCSWLPSGLDWTQAMRACESVREYILLGEADSSTCGDAWATWGVLPPRYDEYGLEEDSPKPYEADGFIRSALPDVARWTICRFDSMAARGFSSCVAFSRASTLPPLDPSPRAAPLSRSLTQPHEAADTIDNDEDLATSWERMQRSLAEGRAQRVAVQMDVDVTSA